MSSLLTSSRISVSFLLSTYLICQQTLALWLYSEVRVFITWGPAGCSHSSGHPSLPQQCSPWALQHHPKPRQGGKSGRSAHHLQFVFTPSSTPPPPVPSTSCRIWPRVFRMCGKTHWNLFVCCFHNTDQQNLFFIRFCIFCEFWKQMSQKVPRKVCFQHRRKEEPQQRVSCLAWPFTPTQTV